MTDHVRRWCAEMGGGPMPSPNMPTTWDEVIIQMIGPRPADNPGWWLKNLLRVQR